MNLPGELELELCGLSEVDQAAAEILVENAENEVQLALFERDLGDGEKHFLSGCSLVGHSSVSGYVIGGGFVAHRANSVSYLGGRGSVW